jgi:hypothetical protein
MPFFSKYSLKCQFIPRIWIFPSHLNTKLAVGSCIILHTTCVCYAIFRICFVLFWSRFLPKLLHSISGLINIEFAFNQHGNYLPLKLVMSISEVLTHVYVPAFSNPVLSSSIHQLSNSSMALNGLPSFSKSSERPAMAVPDMFLSSLGSRSPALVPRVPTTAISPKPDSSSDSSRGRPGGAGRGQEPSGLFLSAFSFKFQSSDPFTPYQLLWSS